MDAVEAPLRFACEKCGRNLALKPEAAGKRIKCPGCGTVLTVPSAPSSAPSQSTPPPPRARPAARREKARSSKRRDQEVVESVLPSRAETLAAMAARREAEAEAEGETDGTAAQPDEPGRPSKKGKRRKKPVKGTGSDQDVQDAVNMIGGALIADVVVGAVAYGYPGIRAPLGAFLAVFGFLMFLVGTGGFAREAGEEGQIYSVMCKIVPLYKWYFLYTRWHRMKGHFAFYAAGLMLLYPGIGLVRFSPAYQTVTETKQETAAQKRAKAMATKGTSSTSAAPR